MRGLAMISSGRYLFLHIPASLHFDPGFQLGQDSGEQVMEEPGEQLPSSWMLEGGLGLK